MDFNKPDTIAKSPTEILHLMVLEKRENFQLALEQYYEKSSKGYDTSPEEAAMLARFKSIFWEIESTLFRKDEKLYDEIFASLISNQNAVPIPELLILFSKLSRFLDELNVTRFDGKTRLGGNLVTRNQAMGNMG